MFQPIYPFEPNSANSIPEGDKWISQIKWDGVRILTYSDGRNVQLFNRKLNERTLHYPELLDISSYCKNTSIILDGEVIALGSNGKPSFHEVMRRDGIRRLDRVDQVSRVVPITYMVFDVIYFNGQWVHNLPLKNRIEILADTIIPSHQVQLVPSHHDGETLKNVIRQQGMEGIVIKDITSTYAIHGKDDRWQKLKNYRDLIAVIGGVTYRDGIVNAVLLGLYNKEGELWYIGHAGTGRLTKLEWRTLTEYVTPLIIKQKPFVNPVERMKQAVWLQPKLAVKVQYMEWTEGNSLRQPSIQAFVDVHPEACTFE